VILSVVQVEKNRHTQRQDPTVGIFNTTNLDYPSTLILHKACGQTLTFFWLTSHMYALAGELLTVFSWPATE